MKNISLLGIDLAKDVFQLHGVDESISLPQLKTLQEKFGGETGIRTLGRFPFNGFQDRRNRPLCHLSVGNPIAMYISMQLIL